MIGVTINDKASAPLDDMEAGVKRALERGVLRAAQEATGIIRKVVMSTFQGRTGNLARSFKAVFIGWSGGGVSAASMSDAAQANILDIGGTIRPRSVKSLAVPIKGANIPVGKWPRHFGQGQLTLIARKGRTPILAKVSSRRVTPMFVLKKSVTIKGRNYLEKAAGEVASSLEDIFGDGIEVEISRAGSEG